MIGDWRIWRGDPPEPEPLHLHAERILAAGGVVVTEHDGELDGYSFEVTDDGLTYKLVANSHGRGLCCDCSTALLQGGGCAHLATVREWFRQRRRNATPAGPFAIW